MDYGKVVSDYLTYAEKLNFQNNYSFSNLPYIAAMNIVTAAKMTEWKVHLEKHSSDHPPASSKYLLNSIQQAIEVMDDHNNSTIHYIKEEAELVDKFTTDLLRLQIELL